MTEVEQLIANGAHSVGGEVVAGNVVMAVARNGGHDITDAGRAFNAATAKPAKATKTAVEKPTTV
jgi:hypothetical protein